MGSFLEVLPKAFFFNQNGHFIFLLIKMELLLRNEKIEFYSPRFNHSSLAFSLHNASSQARNLLLSSSRLASEHNIC